MQPLSRQELASIAEIVGGAAVVVSLLYAAHQVRENTRAMQASSRQEFASQDLAYLATALDSSVIAEALRKLEAGEQLTGLERSQLVHMQHMNFRVFENAHYQFRKRALEASEWARYARIIEVLMREDPAVQAMWGRFARGFVPEFREEVERIRLAPSLARRRAQGDET